MQIYNINYNLNFKFLLWNNCIIIKQFKSYYFKLKISLHKKNSSQKYYITLQITWQLNLIYNLICYIINSTNLLELL